MIFLLSNDDGYLAPGLAALRTALADLGRLVVVAPEQNHSGASQSLTLSRPLTVQQYGADNYAVNGTPADCVHLAVTGLLDTMPDMIIAGINAGANLGDDTLYSGTVAAAIEGRYLGLPAIAVSLTGRKQQNYAAAAQITVDIINKLSKHPLANDTILNINVPDLPLAAIKGIKATRLGQRKPPKPMVPMQDPRGRPVYWVGAAGKASDSGDDTDFAAIKAAYVSVTPLQTDMTRHAQLDSLSRWLAH